MFARISASRPPDHAITAFAGGASAHTMLSPPAVQLALLPLLSTAAALPLRAACRDARAAVAGHEWQDCATVIRGSLAAWRRCFPRAQCANVSGRRAAPLADGDFVHFQGLRRLNVAGWRGITDAAFLHLRGLRALNMRWCSQGAVTDAALAPLRGSLHTLDIGHCSQLTGAAVAHLGGVRVLRAQKCSAALEAAARAAGLPIDTSGSASEEW